MDKFRRISQKSIESVATPRLQGRPRVRVGEKNNYAKPQVLPPNFDFNEHFSDEIPDFVSRKRIIWGPFMVFGLEQVLCTVANVAGRLRMAWMLRLIRWLCPPSLRVKERFRGPLFEAARGGSVDCLSVVLHCGLPHSISSIWGAAGQCFYDGNWLALDYLVSVGGEDVLREQTITAWWHLAESRAPRLIKTRLLRAWKEIEQQEKAEYGFNWSDWDTLAMLPTNSTQPVIACQLNRSEQGAYSVMRDDSL